MADSEVKIKLLDNEKVGRILHPHPFAFYNMYLIWIYVILVSAVFLTYSAKIGSLVGNPVAKASGPVKSLVDVLNTPLIQIIPYVGDLAKDANKYLNSLLSKANRFSNKYTVISVWLLVLIVSSIAVSVVRISWKWILILAGVGVASIALVLYFKLRPEYTYYIAAAISLVGMLFVELYRRAHTFYVTNYRIITELDFAGYKKNELEYSKINNLLLEQSFIGRIFNFGTIIPVTASGLGMGEDMSAVTVGAAGKLSQGPLIGAAVTGGRGIQVPRTRSAYALYGVTSPQETYDLISGFMHSGEEAPYLKDMSQDLKALLEQNKRLVDELTKERRGSNP